MEDWVPNWCQNTVTFKGEPEAISKLALKLTSPVKIVPPKTESLYRISFDQPPWEFGEEFKSDLVPGQAVMSRTLTFLDKDSIGYQEMVRDLGTKWDFDLDGLEVSEGTIKGYASTAWSPPEGWFKLTCARYGVWGELSSGESGSDFGFLLEVTPSGETIEYSSTYNHWECLNWDSIEDYLSHLVEWLGEVEEHHQHINQEYHTWPRSWEEYKQRYRQ